MYGIVVDNTPPERPGEKNKNGRVRENQAALGALDSTSQLTSLSLPSPPLLLLLLPPRNNNKKRAAVSQTQLTKNVWKAKKKPAFLGQPHTIIAKTGERFETHIDILATASLSLSLSRNSNSNKVASPRYGHTRA